MESIVSSAAEPIKCLCFRNRNSLALWCSKLVACMAKSIINLSR